MSRPSILLIPGSFALPEFYDDVVNGVSSKGYSIHALHLPTVGPKIGPVDAEPPSMYADAAFIAKETEKLVDEGKDVVLIGHSYGGVPMSESTKGLGKEEREKEGKKGGVVRLGYLTALVPAVGQPAGAVLAGVPEKNKLNLQSDERGWLYHDPVASAPICFSDIPKEEGEAWMRRFPRHSAISFGNELTHAGYKDIPSSWLLCEEDMCVLEKNQREAIELIEKVSGKKVDVTSIKTGHIPPASAPEKVVDWIVDVAGKV